MSKSIRRQDIAEEGVLDNLLKPLADLKKILDSTDESLKNFASTIEKDLNFGEKAKELRNFNESEQKLNKIYEQKKKVQRSSIDADNEIIKLKAKLEKLNTQEAKDATKLKVAISEKNRELRNEAKAVQNNTTAYSKLSKESRDLKNRSKELGAQLLQLESEGKKNTKEFRQLSTSYKTTTKEAQRTDAQLKKLDSTVGDNFRNVGNYKSALGGLNKVLGAVGIGLGLNQIKSFLTESVNLSRIQEKAVAQVQAGLLSTNNAVGFSLDELKKKASEFQSSTLFGDEQILTDLTSVMLTFTNVTGESFDRAQQSALDLSTRMGGDLKGAAVQLGKALNDPIKGTTALAKSGIQFTQQQKEQIKTLTESGNIVKAQSIILDELNTQFGGSAKAAAEADGGFTQLNNAFNDAREVIGKTLTEALAPFVIGLKEFFLGLDEQKIKAFIADIGSLLKVITTVVAGFLSYKTILIASKLATTAYQVATKGAAIAQALFTGNLKKATAGMKAFNTVTKLNPLGLLVSALTAAVVAFNLFSDSAKDAEDAQEKFNEAAKNGAQKGKESAQALTNEVTNESQERLRVLDNERKKSIANGKSQKDADEQFLKDKKTIIDEEIKAFENKLNEKINLQKQEVIKLEKLQDDAVLNSTAEEANQAISDRLAGEKSLESLKKQGKIELQQLKKNLENFEVEIIEHDSKVTEDRKKAARQRANELKALKRRAEDLEDNRIEDERERRIKQLNRAFEREMEAIKGNSEVEKRIRKELELKLQQDLLDIKKEFSDKSIKLVEDEIARIDAVNEKRKSDQEKDIEDEQQQLRDSLQRKDKERQLANLKTNQSEEEFNEAEKQRQLKHIDEMISLLKLYEGTEDEILELKIQKQQLLQNKANENLKDSTQETMKEVINSLDKFFNNFIAKQMSELQQQESNAKQIYGTLEKLAAEGNIQAQQSLTEMLEVQQKAQREQIRLQQRQQRIEQAKQVYSIIQSQLDAGKSPSEAIASTGGYMTAIQGLISSLPSFYEGTEDTGKANKALDSKGGRLAVLHNNERVLTAQQNKALAGIPNPMIPTLVQKGLDSAGNSYDLLVIDELQKTRKAIESMPQTTYEVQKVMGEFASLIARTKKGNTTTQNKYS